MVRIHPDPPTKRGAIAQLGERLLCKQEVTGSIPVGSTTNNRGKEDRRESLEGERFSSGFFAGVEEGRSAVL